MVLLPLAGTSDSQRPERRGCPHALCLAAASRPRTRRSAAPTLPLHRDTSPGGTASLPRRSSQPPRNSPGRTPRTRTHPATRVIQRRTRTTKTTARTSGTRTTPGRSSALSPRCRHHRSRTKCSRRLVATPCRRRQTAGPAPLPRPAHQTHTPWPRTPRTARRAVPPAQARSTWAASPQPRPDMPLSPAARHPYTSSSQAHHPRQQRARRPATAGCRMPC